MSGLCETNEESMDRLLGLDDEEFVSAAYRTILRRAPDPVGLANYLEQVRSGVSKSQIVEELARSPEASRLAVDSSRFIQLRRPPHSFWNKWIRRLLHSSQETTERQLRIIANRNYRLEKAVALQDKRLKETLSLALELSAHLANITDISMALDGSERKRDQIVRLRPTLAHTVGELKAAILSQQDA
jgi:hypothetical protein